jgi:hypothetical protein
MWEWKGESVTVWRRSAVCPLPGVVVDEEYSAVRVDSLLPPLGQRTQVILVAPNNSISSK